MRSQKAAIGLINAPVTTLYSHRSKCQKEGIAVQSLRFAGDVLQIALVRQGHPHRNDCEHVDSEINSFYGRRYCVVRGVTHEEGSVALVEPLDRGWVEPSGCTTNIPWPLYRIADHHRMFWN